MRQINPTQTVYQHPFKKTLIHAGESVCYNIPSIIGHAYLNDVTHQVPEPVVEGQRVKVGFWLDKLDTYDLQPRRIYKCVKGKTKTYQLPIPKHFLPFLRFNGAKETRVGFRIVIDGNTNSRLIILESE